MTHTDRILLVDSDANARIAVTDFLRGRGYAVEAAADGIKAIPKLLDFAPQLLLTDLNLPGMDGMELLKNAREQDPNRAVVVMATPGNAENALAAMRAGAESWLSKPLNLDELALVVQRTLEIRTLRMQSAGEAEANPGMPVVPGSTLSDLEKYAILRTLEHTGGSTSKAAAILGISARKIQYKLHEYHDPVGGIPRRPGSSLAQRVASTQTTNPQ